MKTTSGPITLERPKRRGNPEPFASRLLEIGVTRTRAVESLVIAGFVRGPSDRDVEATLDEALGEQAALSRSTVSRICQVLVNQLEVWQKRGLSEYELDYAASSHRCSGITDGAPGLVSAFQQVFSESQRQKCTVHYADLWIMPTIQPLRTQAPLIRSA